MTITKKVISRSEVVRMLNEKDEKVMRMKNGIAADIEMDLELKVKNNPDLQSKINEIEKRIFDEIREIINQYENPLSGNSAKRKIITSLKKKK